MKDKITHEVEILGRSVSVLLLAGLLMAAGASAALLDQFATIDGEADVNQAIVVGDEGEAQLEYTNFDSEITAGETVVDGPYEIQNNLGEAYDLKIDSTLEWNGDDEDSMESRVEWEGDGSETFLTTTYADYFADAGVSGYEAPIDDPEHTVSDQDDLLELVNDGEIDDEDVGTGDSVLVEEGTYEIEDSETDEAGLWFEVKDLTLYAEEGEDVTLDVEIDDTTNAVYLEGEGITFTGFEVIHDNTDEESFTNAIRADEEGAEIMHNSFVSDNENTDIGILVKDEAADQATVSHNEVEGDFETSFYVGDDATTGEGTSEASVTAEGNLFTSEIPVFVSDLGEEGEVDLKHNRLLGDEEDVFTDIEDITDLEGDGEVTAENNFFANGVPSGERVDSASYSELDQIDSGDTELGVVNDFELMASGEFDYELTTTIE